MCVSGYFYFHDIICAARDTGLILVIGRWKRLERSKGNTLIVIGLGLVLIISIIISFQLGRYPIPAKEVLGISLSKLYPIEQFWTDRVEMVLINIRLPRIILACLVGCCLSAAGAAYQGVFQNPMAAPDILGASAGAAFGAALAILHYGSSFMITVSAFLQPINGIFSLFNQQSQG